jgi:hypothetical protein
LYPIALAGLLTPILLWALAGSRLTPSGAPVRKRLLPMYAVPAAMALWIWFYQYQPSQPDRESDWPVIVLHVLGLAAVPAVVWALWPPWGQPSAWFLMAGALLVGLLVLMLWLIGIQAISGVWL